MSAAPELESLCAGLRRPAGLLGKRDIQAPAGTFAHQPFPELGIAAALGDDAALLPAKGSPLLLACEGLQPELVEEDPWFAGWCGVLVNLSDIAAMGGRPLALVNSLWCRDPQRAEPLLAGLREGCERFGVPMVGGHTNLRSPYDALSVAVLGTAPGPVLSARLASPGQLCVLLIDPAGHFHRHYPFWDAATRAEPARLRRQLELLVELAGAGLARAAKDISMGGLVGTAVMFAEAAGAALELDLGAITPPEGVSLQAWLTCFPSYGYLLACDPGRLEALQAAAAPLALLCAPIGRFLPPAPEGSGLWLRQGAERACLWRADTPLTGFSALEL
ncbi:MAG: sll0787 family AIR synthase-like protein [Prochlorococcaceae cyanobacterium]|jgi:AIR synthase-related protein